MSSPSKLLILLGSPRREGNSAALARAVQEGAEEAGSEVTLAFIDDYISNFLRDCRTCRKADGECSIEDNFRALFFDSFLPADGVVIASPVYWYGLSAQAKAFFDRTFCYYAASYPEADAVVEAMSRKRIGLVMASEETYPGASLGMVHQIQEYSRYTHSEFVGYVRGVGNSRNEVTRDPSDPMSLAAQLGRDMFTKKFSDFRLDTERSSKVWPEE